MALIKCKECGKEISKKAPTCPQCGSPNKKSASNFGCGTIILLAIVIGVFFSLSKSPNPPKSSYQIETAPPVEKQTGPIDYNARIDKSALSPYTIDSGYQKTVKKFGSRMKEITQYRLQAAKMALDSGKCDQVIMSDLSTKSELRPLLFWVDCENGQRFYLNEDEIESKSVALTQSDKSWRKEDAVTACQNQIKARSLIPSTLDINTILGTSFYKAPITQNAVVKMSFGAKNALGIEHEFIATCHFEPGKVGAIEIAPR